MRQILHHEVHFIGDHLDWMVFIHGAGGSLVTWKHQVKAFKPFFNLLLIDMRDHGYSKDLEPHYNSYDFDIVCDDIIKVVDEVGVTKAHFLALSLGSIILQKLSDRRPDMITSMIMAGGVFKADWKIHLFAHSGKFLSYFLPFRWIYDTFIMIVLPRANHKPSRRLYRLQSKKLTAKEFLKWLGLYRDLFKVVRRFYRRKLSTSSLVVMGGQDHVFLDAAKRFTSKHAHAAELVVIDGVGHLCNLEATDVFNRAVLRFLNVATPTGA
ncbi:2-succinyl-6-hydroxy-2,4-cyclohexadiene-1-carboxylate synthase [Lewinellaceae bacterium SD302]|nr:2-succinyl-6-hydroxy-2,4-cyclohexadiene-1-carboxylate synthase [Lewinellaceae bacterium SD302]